MSVKTKENGITFAVHEVEPSTNALPLRTTTAGLNKLLERQDKKDDNPKVLYHSEFNSNSVADVGFHPLIACVHTAFSQHRPLILSPDIIWLTIVQGFAQHINNNAEKLRDKFVSHKGKKQIIIIVQDIYAASPESAWDIAVEKLSAGLGQELGPMHGKLISNFSTTGANERIACEVALLDAFQAYFEYVLMCVCGIPEIKLLGEQSDWQNLRQKIDLLNEYELDWWLPHVKNIADQFVRASAGDIDIKHWQNIYKKMEAYGGDDMNGWILKLIPYLKCGKTGRIDVKNWQLENDEWPDLEAEASGDAPGMSPMNIMRGMPNSIRSNSLPSGISMAPFILRDMERDNTASMQFLGGFIGIEQDSNLALKPRIGWAVRESPVCQATFSNFPESSKKKDPLDKETFDKLISKLSETKDFGGITIPGDMLNFYRDCNGLTYKNLTIRPLEELYYIKNKRVEELLASTSGMTIGEMEEHGIDHEKIFAELQKEGTSKWLHFADYDDGSLVKLEIQYNSQKLVRETNGEKVTIADSLTEFFSNLDEMI